MDESLRFSFSADVIHWRGPAPFYFLRVPPLEAKAISEIAKDVSYGWGVIPSNVEIESLEFYTALIPKDGSYLVPLKKSIRSAVSIDLGDEVTARVHISLAR